MIRLPSINWQYMRGSTNTLKRLNGWLAGRYVDGLAPESECEYEAKVIADMHKKMPAKKFKPWLMRYLYKQFVPISENPRPRDTDHRQIVEILEMS